MSTLIARTNDHKVFVSYRRLGNGTYTVETIHYDKEGYYVPGQTFRRNDLTMDDIENGIRAAERLGFSIEYT